MKLRRKDMKKMQARNSCLLLLTAIVWGMAFVAQSTGMEHVGPFTFNSVRNVIGGLVLIPVIMVIRKINGEQRPFITKIEFIGGVCCGIALFVASSLQQQGILYTTVGKAGFITALYVVIVPILGLFFRKKMTMLTWGCVALSVVGLYLLCMTGDSFTLNRGDLMILICAAVFAVHILIIDYFSPKGDGVMMACIQFLTCGILAGIGMAFEQPTVAQVLGAKWPILYAGILSCGVGYTLQIVGQKGVNPTVASLIMCLESVVAVIAGWLFLHEVLSVRELVGCVLMFVAIVVAQLPTKEVTEI